jgi:hypothetical protein
MTAAGKHIVEDFESLPDPEKREVLANLLRISRSIEYPEVSDKELTASADTLFVEYDRRAEPAFSPSGKGGDGGSGTFDLLGFTHHWKRGYRSGVWVVGQKTAKSRMTRAIRKVSEWCRANRHCKVAEQCKGLVLKLRGHYQYYGITGNRRALHSFYESVRRQWHRWLNRRSQRRSMTWERFEKLLQHHVLPEPIVVHSIYRAQRTRDLRSRMQ